MDKQLSDKADKQQKKGKSIAEMDEAEKNEVAKQYGWYDMDEASRMLAAQKNKAQKLSGDYKDLDDFIYGKADWDKNYSKMIQNSPKASEQPKIDVNKYSTAARDAITPAGQAAGSTAAGGQGTNEPKQASAPIPWISSADLKKIDEMQQQLPEEEAKAKQFMDAYMDAAYNYQMAPSEEYKAIYDSARSIKDAQDRKITHIKNTIYDLGEANKKASLENTVLTAPDYNETLRKAAQKGKENKTGKDKNGKIIDLLNSPELMRYARQTSALTDGIMIAPGSGLTKGIASLPVGVDLKYAYINDAEADKLRYLKEKGDTAGIEKYLQLIDRDLNERQTKGDMAQKQQGYDQLGWVGKVGAGVDSFGNSFNTGLAFLDTAANGLNQRFGGEYVKPDVYSPWQRPSNMKRMDREYVTQDMEPVWKAVTNFGMDALEATPKLMMPGGAAYYAVSDAGDAANEALMAGDDYQTAAGKATAQGLFEYMAGKAAEKTFKYFKDLNKTPEGVKIGEKGAAEGVGSKLPNANKPYANSRPSYGKTQVEDVWNTHANPKTGRVTDPAGVEFSWDKSIPRRGQWDMGHIPGQKYADIHARYMSGEINSQEFLDWYRNPANYRPELPSTNRSRLFE